MKKTGAYKRSWGLVMVAVMSVHIFSGWGILCAKEALRPIRALGSDPVAYTIAAPDYDGGGVVGRASSTPESKQRTSKCCCKKQKKCPPIPRAAITSNPTHRFYEGQFQAVSLCCQPLVPQETGHWFAAKGAGSQMDLAWCAPFFCSNPLALTSVLLI
jgi:hypothetical protein